MTDLKNLVYSKSAILFDMDGTLVNTEPLHAQAAALVMEELGVKAELLNDLSQFYGMTDHTVLKTICPHMSESEITHAILEKNKKLIHLFNHLNEDEKLSYLTPGIIPFLRELNNKNIAIAVVSASEDIIVTETLKCFGLTKYFKFSMGRNQTELTKPHPDPYLEAMKRLNVSAQDTLIFEDSPTGMKSAIQANASVIRITAFAHDSNQILPKNVPEINHFKMFECKE